MKAMPVHPSFTLAYFDPSLANARHTGHRGSTRGVSARLPRTALRGARAAADYSERGLAEVRSVAGQIAGGDRPTVAKHPLQKTAGECAHGELTYASERERVVDPIDYDRPPRARIRKDVLVDPTRERSRLLHVHEAASFIVFAVHGDPFNRKRRRPDAEYQLRAVLDAAPRVENLDSTPRRGQPQKDSRPRVPAERFGG